MIDSLFVGLVLFRFVSPPRKGWFPVKKIIALFVLAAALITGVVGCGGKEEGKKTGATETKKST